MTYTREHLAEVGAADVCAAVGLSDRSLRRQFRAATGMSWRQYRQTSRVLGAMAILAESRRTVLDVATAVGFESLSAFNRAFLRLTGETPGAYRRRITTQDAARSASGGHGRTG